MNDIKTLVDVERILEAQGYKAHLNENNVVVSVGSDAAPFPCVILMDETNLTIRESLKLTSQTIKEASEKFSKALEDTMKIMSDLTIQLNVRDTVLKNLGIDGMIPDFLKKRK